MKHSHQLFLATLMLALLPMIMDATIIVQGNSGTTTQTFNAPIVAKAFDAATGALYLGLGSGTDDEYAIAYVNRYFGVGIIKATGIANSPSDPALNGTEQQFLALAGVPGAPAYILTGSTLDTNTVFALATTGTSAIASSELIDATIGSESAGIAALTANNNFIFAAVKPNGGSFGQTNSGIAAVRIARNINYFESLGTLDQTDAATGGSTPQALKLDATNTQVKTAATTNNPTIADAACVYWDDVLQRLYIGLQLTAGNAINDGIKSVVVARINDENGMLTFSPIIPTADAALLNNLKNQIVVSKNNGSADPGALTVNEIRVMHTSTGLSYLIINGGNGDTSEVGNKIFALPLIDNASDAANNGTLANKNILTNGTFQTVPAVAAELPTDITITPSNYEDTFALVGGTSLFPLSSPNALSDLVVIGDTVYASSNTVADATNESGIFYSQALFDNTGKITRWTPWSKRAFPTQTTSDGQSVLNQISLFQVDAATGKIWATTGSSDDTLESTAWDFGMTATSLPAKVTDALYNGAYSVADLHEATLGLGAANANRYALFGGAGTVVFARTSISAKSPATQPLNSIVDTATGFTVTAPQTIITDYADASNFLITTLPNEAGCVTSLEFSQTATTAGNEGYFFAGTAQGLYVFSQGGNGFDVNSFGALNTAPFTSGGWSLAPTIVGAITDIQTRGQMLYVISFLSTPMQPYASTLWRIPYDTTVNGMFAAGAPIKIAQTGVGIFANTSLFTGIQILATGGYNNNGDGAKEQLVLTTNTGIYNSNADQSGINTGIIGAADQTAAQWTAIDLSTMYSGIAGMDTPLPSTVWPISVEDPSGRCINNASSINQISGDGNPAGTAFTMGSFNPADFNTSTPIPAFTTLAPIISFWSDGARRLFTVKRSNQTTNRYRLLSLPFNTRNNSINASSEALLSDPALATSAVFYWTQQIGATGIVMAGTDTGVVALE